MSKSAHTARFSKRQPAALSSGCKSGAFYKSPKKGDDVDTSKNIDIEWDTSLNCFSSKGVDIYLYAPYSTKGLLHVWGGVDYNSGKFSTELVGSWWNSSVTPTTLQLGFVEANTPIFTAPISQGPMFSATFNATDFSIKHPIGGDQDNANDKNTDSDGGGIFQAVNNALKSTGLSKGSIAAAVVVPLLAVILAIFAYVKFQRRKEAAQRKRWSQAVDKRMGAISSEWKTLPPNAQSEAIRQSIAIMRNSRASMARMSQIYAEGRPSSTFAVDGAGAAGVGVRKGTGVGPRNVAMGPAQMANRKSAVSFAADTRFSRSSEAPDVPKLRPSTDRSRPSTETQRGRASRAFHTAISASYDDNFDIKEFDTWSPSQTGSTTPLKDRDIRPFDLSKDIGVLPALNLIQQSEKDNEIIFLAQSPMDPSFSTIASPPPTRLSPTTATTFKDNMSYNPAYANVTNVPAVSAVNVAPVAPSATSPVPVVLPTNNPFSSFMRGPSIAMSPDDMLRAYATRDGGQPARTGTPMETVAPRALSRTPSSPSMKSKISYPQAMEQPKSKLAYPAFDAPAPPEPVRDMDIVPGPPPLMAGVSARTLYQPGQGHGENRVVSHYEDEDAYGGYGNAT